VIAPRAPRCSELSSNDALAERPRPCPQHDPATAWSRQKRPYARRVLRRYCIRNPLVVDIRKKELTVLSGAESSYNDWRGTACAEDSMLVGAGDLYELAGIADERERWSILGIELEAFSHGADPQWTIRVYAADRLELGVSSFEDWARVAAEHGGIPVVDILLHDATPDAVIKCMKLVGIQLRRGNIEQPLLHAA